MCEFEILAVDDKYFSHAPVQAGYYLEVSDNASIQRSKLKLGRVSNLGKKTKIGNNVAIKEIYAGNEIHFSDSADQMEAYSALKINRQDVKALGLTSNEDIATYSFTIDAPSRPTLDVSVNNKRHLEPGNYKDLVVNRGGDLSISTGVYYFSKLTLLAESKLTIENEKGTPIIVISDEFTYKGAFDFEHLLSDILFIYMGKKPIQLKGKFDGTLLAPMSTVSIDNANDETHMAMFYADQIYIGKDTKIRRTTVSKKGDAFKKLKVVREGNDHQMGGPSYVSERLTFPDTPTGELLNSHIVLMNAMGPNAQENYEDSLAILYENIDEVLPLLSSTYSAMEETLETQHARYELVSILGDIEHDNCLNLLNEIAVSPVNKKIASMRPADHFFPRQYEDMLRTRAIGSIGSLAGKGNQNAENALIDFMNHDNRGFTQKFAAVSYMANGDRIQRAEELRKILSEDKHHLTQIEFDINVVDPQ